jgi:MoaA/NifB/PqqE/SkfB family radical SAM enzyme
MNISLSPMEKLHGFGKFLDVKLHRRPLTVSLEVTKRCNARCDFCDYWKITDRDELTDFTGIIKKFDPLVVVLTGGEPMLRRDLVAIVKSLRDLPGFRYIALLTHGGFLNDDKIRALVGAGLNHINISMNYPDDRQDKERGIPKLFERVEKTVKSMVAEGVNPFSLASILMLDNMHDAEKLVRLAHSWGINIGFSGYNDMKNGNQIHFVAPSQLREFKEVCAKLKQLKRDLGNITTSDYFFDRLPEFYEKREIAGCRAGQIMIHVSPKGMVQPCAELPAISHWESFEPAKYAGPNCGKCFDACRADAEAPIDTRRVAEFFGFV